MGKRLAIDNLSIPTKKKKLNGYQKQKRKNSSCSSNDPPSSDDESNVDTIDNIPVTRKADLPLSENDSSPRPVYQLSGDMVNGAILTDIKQKQWRIGKPVGKGSFGEIFLASDYIKTPVTMDNAKYVVKIEPHSNGPLFVEIHCLINVNKNTEEDDATPGVPSYIASGSHYFRNERYRFLVLPRFDRDLHSIIKHCRVSQKSLLVLAVQILDILQVLHDKGYCHSDIKAENLMIGKCTYNKSLVMSYKSKDIDSDNESTDNEVDSSNEESKSNDEDSEIDDIESYNENSNQESDSDEEEEDEEESQSEVSNPQTDSESNYKTPVNSMKGRNKRNCVEFSGSNPVRTCRSKNNSANTTYQEMINSHYLRPSRKVNYSLFFNDENSKSPRRDDKNDCDYDNYDSSSNAEYKPNNCRLKYRNSTNNSSLSKSNRKSNYNNNSKLNQSSSIALRNYNDYITEDRLFLIDYGLASKFVDVTGVHRPFCMDQRRAHDGTLEFTSRDAHMGAHSRRSDLECLGYNLIFWSQGFLPWREKAALQQPEKVHGMKEYLMADVRQMLKHIYGKQVPKYLGEFMYYVGKLAYDERPDYEKLKMIFIKEYKKLGFKVEQMKLELDDLIKNSINVKQELRDKNILEMKNIKSIMKNLGVIMPFQETNVSRVSPKNLRSKEKNSCKKKKKFSWAEILSQDPDQIARERAEKEFEREPTETPVIRFKGKPTYAILEIQNRLKKFKDRLDSVVEDDDDETENLRIKGYNKQMIDVLKKRQQSLFADVSNNSGKKSNKASNSLQNNVSFTTPLKEPNRRLKDSKRSKEIIVNNSQEFVRTRNKEGLRTTITPTKRGLDYNCAKEAKKRGRKRLILDNINCDNSNIIGNSCSSICNTNGVKNSGNVLIDNSHNKRRLMGIGSKSYTRSYTRSNTTSSNTITLKSTNNNFNNNRNNNSGCELSGTDESSCSSIHSLSSSNENSRSSAVSSRKSTRSKSSAISSNSASASASTSSSMAAAAVTAAPSSSSATQQKVICGYQQTLKTVAENENSNSSTNSNNSCSTTNSNNSFPPASLSDEDTRDVMVSFPPSSRSTIKNNRTRNSNNNNHHNINNTKPPINRVRIRINGTASIVKEISPINIQPQHPVIINGSNGIVSNGNNSGGSRRKKSIPQKRNVKSEYLRCV